MGKKELETEVEIGEYKGAPVIKIWEKDNDGKRREYPLISFGKRKAEILLKHLKELEDFAKQ